MSIMSMSSEDINEIIRALANGRTAENIAAVVDITETEVKEISEKYAAEIEEMKNWQKELGAE